MCGHSVLQQCSDFLWDPVNHASFSHTIYSMVSSPLDLIFRKSSGWLSPDSSSLD